MKPLRALGLIATLLLSSAAWVAAADGESITVTAKIAGDKIALTWNAVAGESYAVKETSDLSLPWTDVVTVPSPLVAQSNLLGYAVLLDSSPRFFQVIRLDPMTSAGMALIPASNFQMGDTFGEGDSDERPMHTVSLSGFYMDTTEVTLARWREVRNWAILHGYSFDNEGSGKGLNHPIQTVNWYDVVKWCNARSEQEGRTPAYYRDADLSVRYRTGQVAPYVKWDGGYRLPTEAEWEKAARGGSSGERFPWGDTVSHSLANYCSSSHYSYDDGPTRDCHPTYATGDYPYTSPVGSFAANAYGLSDMAGNVSEWCGDCYKSSYYGSSPAPDPRGPASSPYRVIRGGGWSTLARGCRVTERFNFYPVVRFNDLGFRSILPSGQPGGNGTGKRSAAAGE